MAKDMSGGKCLIKPTNDDIATMIISRKDLFLENVLDELQFKHGELTEEEEIEIMNSLNTWLSKNAPNFKWLK